ncbi:YD repeat-containing protein, partial [Pseudomonas syringae pv. japonica str. M301072]
NILLVNDASQPDRYCGNQRIEPINRYCYDTLYQ